MQNNGIRSYIRQNFMNFQYSKAKRDSLYRTKQRKNCLRGCTEAEMRIESSVTEKTVQEAW